MDKVKDEVVTKCVKCNQEMVTGQKFCTECGSKQNVPMRTAAEVSAMRKLIFAQKKPPDPKQLLGNLVVMMSIDMGLSWVLGNVSDLKLLGLISGEGRGEGGGE